MFKSICEEMKKIKTAIITLSALFAPLSYAGTFDRPDIRVPENRVVYSVYLRNYTNTGAAGTFNDLRKDLPRIKELGIDVIHLLPFYEMGVEHAKGSPYCIRNYKAVDSRYGTLEDLKALVDDIHKNGMQIWFDWVGNHTAYDNPWVTEHPEWYTERQDFDDVRSVESSNKELRSAMAECMKYWVEECGIDGYRCDFAHAPGRDFWTDIIGQVDPDHKLYWLAEGNEEGIANDWVRGEGGPFDSRYGWTYSEFLYQDHRNHKELVSKGDLDKALFHLGYPANRATFLTYIGSHDIFQGMENSVSPNTQDYIYGDNLNAFTVVTMLAPGVPMVYMGQEINYSKAGGVGIMTDNEAVEWDKVDTGYLTLVKELISLRHSEPALRTVEGKLVNHATDNDSVYVFERRNGDHSVVAMVNMSYAPVSFKITSPVIPSNEYRDRFGGNTTVLSGNILTLPGKGYAVYTKKDEPLDVRGYEIRLTVPGHTAENAVPKISVTTRDPLEVGGEVTVLEPCDMKRVEGSPDVYSTSVPYLPDFGYDITFTDGNAKSAWRDTIHMSAPADINHIVTD